MSLFEDLREDKPQTYRYPQKKFFRPLASAITAQRDLPPPGVCLAPDLASSAGGRPRRINRGSRRVPRCWAGRCKRPRWGIWWGKNHPPPNSVIKIKALGENNDGGKGAGNQPSRRGEAKRWRTLREPVIRTVYAGLRFFPPSRD